MTEQSAETGTAIVSIEDQIKKNLALLNQQVTRPPSNKISTDGKRFTLPGGEPRTDPLQVVIIDYLWVLAHYPGVYKKGKPQSPDCFAVGRSVPDDGGLAPHDDSPTKMADNCGDCKHNKWGTGAGGRGKACKHSRRLIVASLEAGEDEDITALSIYVSPTALKNFDAYIRDLAADGLDPIQVITVIDFDPNETYPKLTFKRMAKHASLAQMWSLRERYKTTMTEGTQGLVKSGDGDN